MKPRATPTHKHDLTDDQAQALELLLDGESVSETARKTGISRQTVSKWRNQHPVFVADLNAAMRDRLTATHAGMFDLAPKALAVLTAQMEAGGEDATETARDILRLLASLAPVQIGPTTAGQAEHALDDHPNPFLRDFAAASLARAGVPFPDTDDADAWEGETDHERTSA
jgi:transposase-like protein